jgi:hypothetical protein
MKITHTADQIRGIAMETARRLREITGKNFKVSWKYINSDHADFDLDLDGVETDGGTYDICEWNGKGLHVVNYALGHCPAYFKLIKDDCYATGYRFEPLLDQINS